MLSAHLDGELDGAQARVADAHLAACPSCRAQASAWDGLDAALAAMPTASPSARVDAGLARFRRAPAPLAHGALHQRIVWPLRAAVAAAVATAVLLGVPQQGSRDIATQENDGLVAAVQQSVLDARTGTLYVLHPQQALVAALDAATLAQRGVIAVGGRPTALALNPHTDEVLVLDAEAKTLTAIATRTNSVVGSTAVAIPGTPTSIQVDGGGKVIVASILPPLGGDAAPSPAASPKAQGGAVTIIDPATRTVRTISQVDVAPRQVVIEPSGKRALLVSSQGTTVVDAATYKALDRTAGGIAGAFSGSGQFAILSAKDGAAFVTFSAYPGVALPGAPRAIAALPDGGYAVLTEVRGQGRLVALSATGAVLMDVPSASGRDLSFDPVSGKLAVIGADGVSVVPLPEPIAAAPTALPAVPQIVVTAPPQANPAASPTPSRAPSASPSASAAPSASPSAAVARPDPDDRPSALVPTGARLLTGTTYLYEPPRPGRSVRVAGDGSRIWTLDAQNRLSALHIATGEVFTVASFPRGARISEILVSPGYVYLTDPTVGTLYVVSLKTERWTSAPIPFLSLVRAAVTSPDDRLWLVVDALGLVSFEPRSQRIEVADVGATRFSAIGVDARGRVWLAPRDRPTLSLYDAYSGQLSELQLARGGTVTALLVDASGALWVGTDTGEVFAIRDSSLDRAAATGRAIERLIAGPSGKVWYVSRAGGEVTFGPADGSALALHGPLAMSTPVFDVLGRAWAQDGASGGFFVTLPPGRR